MNNKITFDELKAKALEDDTFKKEWEQSEAVWNIKKQLIKARIDSKLTQQDVADKMHVKQSAIARFEKTQNCSVSTLISYAKAVGLKKLEIT